MMILFGVVAFIASIWSILGIFYHNGLALTNTLRILIFIASGLFTLVVVIFSSIEKLLELAKDAFWAHVGPIRQHINDLENKVKELELRKEMEWEARSRVVRVEEESRIGLLERMAHRAAEFKKEEIDYCSGMQRSFDLKKFQMPSSYSISEIANSGNFTSEEKAKPVKPPATAKKTTQNSSNLQINVKKNSKEEEKKEEEADSSI
jgi:hypothetical protein